MLVARYGVSVLFNEPKLLKWRCATARRVSWCGFSALQRAEIAEIGALHGKREDEWGVSVLFNEPKLLKC